MPGTKYSPAQKKIAQVAEPRDKINGKDFAKLRKNKPKKKQTMMSSKSYG